MRLFSTSLFSTSVMISIILVGGTTAANAQYSGTGTGSGSGSGYSATQMQQAVMAAEYATIAYLNTPNQANLTTAQARVDALIPYNSTRSTVDSSLGVYSYAQKKLSATILYSRAKIVINVHRDTPSNANLTLANQAVALLVPYNNIPSDISGYNLHSAAQRNLEGVSKYVLAKTAITAYSAARNQSNLTIAQNAVAAVQPFNNFPSGQNTLGLYSAAKQSLDQAVAALIPSITLTSPRGGENISNSGNANEAFLMTFNVVNRAQIPSTAVMTMSLEAQAGGTSGVLGTLSAFGLTTALNNGQVRMNFDIVEGSPTARPVVPGPGYKLHVKIYTNSTKTQLLSSSLSNAFTIVNSPHIEQGLRLYNDAINGANNYNAAINPQADFYNAVVALIELVKPYNDIPDGNRGLYDAAREHFGGIVYNKAIQLANSYDAAINPQADFYNGVVALIELVKPYNDIKDGDKGLYDAAREHFGGIVYNKAIQLANSYDAAINPQADFYNGVVALIELVKPYNNIKDGDKGLYDAAREHFGGIVYTKAIEAINNYKNSVNPTQEFYDFVVAQVELVRPFNDIKLANNIGLYDDLRQRLTGIQPPQASVGLVLTSPAGGESISNSANYNYSYPVTFNVVNKNSVPATAIMTMSLEGGSTSGVLGALNSGGLTNALNEGRVKINFNLVEGSPSARLVIPGSGYRLRIRLYADANGTRLLAESVSNAFTIVAAPSISITSPQGGESISNSGNSTDAFPVTFNVVNKNSVPATAIMTLSLEGGSTSGVLGGLNSGGLTNALNAGQVKINFNIVERSPGVVPVVPGAGYRLHIRLYADPYTNQLLSESLSNSFTIVSVSLVQEAKNAIDHFFTIRSQYGAGSPEDTAAMNAMNAAMQAVDSAHQTEVTTYYNYKKALYIIAQYIKTPNQENLNYALAIIEYLKPLNSIQVSATNKLGLYDDAITRLIQAVKNNVVQTNKISPIAGSYVVAVDNGRVFVTMDTGVINQYQWDPITKTQKLTLTINPPSGVNCAQSFGHPISVKGNTLVAYGLCRNAFITEQATARLYIYKFNAQTNQWNQQKSINQKRITGSADLRDYLDLQSLINSPTEIGINWAFSQVDVPNHPGDVSESILFTILSSGTFYGKAFVLDHQLAYNSLNSINPNSAQTVWTTSSAPGILTGDKAINVDADGNYAIINTTASLLPKFAVLSSTLNQRTVSGEVVYFKSWQEELVPALNNTKMTLASLAINEEAYPQAPIGVGAGVPGKVTIAIGSQYESEVQTTGIITGKIFTLSGMINPVTKAITWDALKPLAVVMPYTTNQQAGFTLSLKNKTLVVGTSATQILGNSTRLAQLPSLAANLTDLPSNPVANPGMVMVYKFDSTQNQWLWNYNVYKNRLNDSTSFGISLGTDGSTVAAATIGFSGSSSNEVTVVNPS